MKDIVERLRELAPVTNTETRTAMTEAAAEIERLRKDLSLAVFADNEYWQVLEKENERLRAALERFACTCDRAGNAECSSGEVDCPFWQARAALEGKS